MPKTTKSSPQTVSTSPPKEKRLLRYRSTCPAKLYERLHRASSQRLYLIQRTDQGPREAVFSVLGSTGNVYEVTLSQIPSCSCPDFTKKQDLCKHVLFVLTKVVGVDVDNPLAFQRAYLASELDELLIMSRDRQVGGSVMANQQVRESFARATASPSGTANLEAHTPPRRSLANSDCPICFDRMLETDETTSCHAVCGATFHKDCMRRWIAATRQQQGQAPTCPHCRSVWQSETSSLTAAGEEGYVNLGALQGQSPVRDTSTYYDNRSPAYKRRRYGYY